MKPIIIEDRGYFISFVRNDYGFDESSALYKNVEWLDGDFNQIFLTDSGYLFYICSKNGKTYGNDVNKPSVMVYDKNGKLERKDYYLGFDYKRTEWGS